MPTETMKIPLGEDGYARLDIRRGRRWATVLLDLWPSNFNLTDKGRGLGRQLIESYMDDFKKRCRPVGSSRTVGFPHQGVGLGAGKSLVHLGPIPKENAQQIADMFIGLLDPANLEDIDETQRAG